MTIRNLAPSPALRPFIKSYYLVKANFTKPAQEVFFADGCPEIVFNYGLDFYRNDVKEPWAKVIGQIIDPLSVKAEGNGKSFGIWFYPHGFAMISDIPAKELTNTAIPLDTLFPRDLIDFVGECLAKNEISRLTNTLNRYFERSISRQIENPQAAVANFALKELSRTSSESSLAELAEKCNISPRYLQKVFANRIGLTPKQLQRVVRFQKTLAALNTHPNKELTAITYEAGYYDQSHFIREFKRFTKISPSRYNVTNFPINKLFLSSL